MTLHMYKDTETLVRSGAAVTDGFKVGWDYVRDSL